ncbi:hypothetical protein M422DRAFT_26032 [Sphaerobolus stellatus SS14]|nr:hypothetical protein M422DRAFT_26032 [Sphaerobolus stellatus SS14]
MAPFTIHSTGVEGIKERIEALSVQGDRLYLGTATGDLNIYSLNREESDSNIELLETKKSLCRRAIEQIGIIKDTNSLVVLSDGSISLYGLPDLSPVSPLTQAKNALSFMVHTAVVNVLPNGEYSYISSEDSSKEIPSVITRLVVGCRKKVVVYTWRDGEVQDTKELPLPHSPRAVAFVCSRVVCLAYTANEQVLLSLDTMKVSEASLPNTNTASVGGIGMTMGMGAAFSGLGGYMTLGLGGKEKKPAIVKVDDDEVLIPKDNSGIFIGPEGKPTRSLGIDWPGIPEENVFIKPYILSILPPGSAQPRASPQSQVSQQSPSSYLQIYSTISLVSVQTLIPPFSEDTHDAPSKHYGIRLLSASSQDKSPLFLVMAPLERASVTAEGTSLWMVKMCPWGEQIDELVDAGSYTEALRLLDMIDKVLLPDKDERQVHIRTLQAVSQFTEGQYENAIDTFIELNVNPAKVVGLYPESIAGRLAVPKEKWFELHGGHAPGSKEAGSSHEASTVAVVEGQNQSDVQSILRSSLGGRWGGLDRLVPGMAHREDDAGSISERSMEKKSGEQFHKSVETLLRYLGDRRPKLTGPTGALSAFHITPAQISEYPLLSETSTEELFGMPNAPLSTLGPEQLVRYAQILDTAFFKSYLTYRPALIGSLCRIPNWCEVTEVEHELRGRKKFSELIDLYNGKRMHEKALSLLKEMSEEEDDIRDKLQPIITYLQKLGPQYLQQVFDGSRWVLERDSDMGFEIFTSEEHDLPKQEVADFLDDFNPRICVRYLEFLVDDRHDTSRMFHERLAESYMNLSMKAKEEGNTELQQEMYSKLLKFIRESEYYEVDSLFANLPSDDMYEARAILLGRLGKHRGALEIYVYRLKDYLKAEEYCKQVYHADPQEKRIFLTLLRIYLHSNTTDLLHPALELISRHSPRLDAVETLNLLPPMVSAQDLNAFLCEALRTPVFDTQVIREIWKSRSDQLSSALIGLQNKRVKITDSRICPQCHKRIGNTVISVHAPRGEVTHYTCREAFSKKLNEKARQ